MKFDPSRKAKQERDQGNNGAVGMVILFLIPLSLVWAYRFGVLIESIVLLTVLPIIGVGYFIWHMWRDDQL